MPDIDDVLRQNDRENTRELVRVRKWLFIPEPCADCGSPDRIWMAQWDLWERYGNGCGRLCIPCFERRLGRVMSASDLLDSNPPCNADLMCTPREKWFVHVTVDYR